MHTSGPGSLDWAAAKTLRLPESLTDLPRQVRTQILLSFRTWRSLGQNNTSTLPDLGLGGWGTRPGGELPHRERESRYTHPGLASLCTESTGNHTVEPPTKPLHAQQYVWVAEPSHVGRGEQGDRGSLIQARAHDSECRGSKTAGLAHCVSAKAFLLAAVL